MRDYLLLTGINVTTWVLVMVFLVGYVWGIGWIDQWIDEVRLAKALDGLVGVLVLIVSIGTLFLLAAAVQYVSVEPDIRTALERLDPSFQKYFLALLATAFLLTMAPVLRTWSIQRTQTPQRRGGQWVDHKEAERAAWRKARRDPITYVAWVGLIMVASTAVTLAGSVKWAHEIAQWGEGGAEPSGPIGLGEITLSGDEPTVCAVRVSERVLAGESVVVTDDVTSFRVKNCDGLLDKVIELFRTEVR